VVQPVMFRGELAAIIYVGGFMEAKRRRELASSGNPGIADLLPPEFEPSRKEECCRIAVFLAEFIRCELELESATFQESGKHHSVDYYCKQVQDLITIRYRENITLEEAAKICKLNPNYLSALLVRKLGKSFRQLLNEQRLTEAESCIKYAQMSIAEIAVSCGFRDANYFSVVFKKYRGITPGEYRDNWVTMEHEMFTRSRNPRK
jgi:AraC-like DNA-binding protein